jgi:hypothetical protein
MLLRRRHCQGLLAGDCFMPSRSRFVLFAVFLLSAIPVTPASAIPITVSFTASGFGGGAPTDPVAGSVVYDATSTTAPPSSLTSINLTIAGHAYSLAEVGFDDSTLIGGLINGVDAVMNNTNDFFLSWDASAITPVAFVYSCASCNTDFLTFTFTQFSVTAGAAVPEPNSLTLLAGALCFCVSLHLVRRRPTKAVSGIA